MNDLELQVEPPQIFITTDGRNKIPVSLEFYHEVCQIVSDAQGMWSTELNVKMLEHRMKLAIQREVGEGNIQMSRFHVSFILDKNTITVVFK